jgi:hypothetical protein
LIRVLGTHSSLVHLELRRELRRELREVERG